MKTRIYFLDNLRTFLIFLVVLLHSAITYSYGMDSFWIVVDAQKSEALGLVNMYLDLFVMFIMFFISGYFIPNSKKVKTPANYVINKFKRIMVPWLIAVFTLVPAYKAVFLLSRGLPQEEWYSYFTFFHRAGTDLTFYPNNPTQSWLWFLPVLFFFQVVYLMLSKISFLDLRISLKTAVISLFIIGLVYSLAISGLNLKGWYHSPLLDFQRERLLIYFMSFLLGALCAKLKIFDSQEKHMKYYIISNIVMTISLGLFTVVALNFFFNIVDPQRNFFIISEMADRIAYYGSGLLAMLTFLHVLVHTFRFNLNRQNWLMSQLNQSSYSVYIIHVIVLGVVALGMINLEISGFVKFLILTSLSYLISNVIVFVYRRWFFTNITLRISTFTVMVLALFAFIRFNNKPQMQSGSTFIEGIPAKVNQVQLMNIHEAVIRGDVQIIQEYIKAGSDLNEKEPAGGSSPIITAALFGKTEIVAALLNSGAEVNFRNNEGSTALHTAAFFCRTEIVKLLLENDADVNIKNNSGTTPLESVSGPFDSVKGIYDYFEQLYGPMGLELNDEYLKNERPIITEMLSSKK